MERTLSAQEAIDVIGIGRFQLLCLFLTGSVWMMDAIEAVLMSFLLPALELPSTWNLSPTMASSIAASSYLAMMIGAPTLGYLSDKFGRKVVIVWSNVALSVFSVACAFSPDVETLLLLRALAGFAMGSAPVAFQLFAELLPSAQRGRWTVYFEFSWTVGTVLMVLIAWASLPTLGWRWMIVFTSLPVCIATPLCWLLPESPLFLMQCGRVEEAQQVVYELASANDALHALPKHWTLELANKETAKEEEEDDDDDDDDDDQQATLFIDDDDDNEEEPLLATSATTTARQRCGALLYSIWTHVAKLFAPEYRLTTLLLWLLWAANALVYNGVVLSTPSMFSDGGADLSSSAVYVSVLIATVAEAPGLALAALLIDRLGRRWLQASLFALFALFQLLFLVPDQHSVFYVAIGAVARGLIMAAYATTYSYTPEVYPTAIRSAGMGFAVAASKVSSVATPYVALLLLSVDERATIIVYGGVAALASLASLFLPIETKYQRLE
jgi:MFS family permease